MKRRFRFISLILVIVLFLPSAFAFSANAEDGLCPICGNPKCAWEIQEISPATCKTQRHIRYICNRYGYEEDDYVGELDPENHENPEDIELVTEKSVEPTCTESGCEVYRYNDCGAEISIEILPIHPAGHDYAAVNLKCTDTTANLRCTICGDTKTEPRKPVEHNYKADSFSCDDGFINYHCTVCGAKKQEAIPAEHKWSDWNMVKVPTASADGQRTRTCAVCGKNETETVPAGTVSRFIKEVSLGDTTVQYKSTAVIEPEIISASGAKIKVEYSSSAPDIVSVDNNGNVTARKTGSAVITVTAKDADGFPVSCKSVITVKYAWWQWIINILLLGFLWY